MEFSPIQRFWNLLKQYKPELRQIYAYAIFNGLVNLSLPLGIQAIINYIQTREMSSAWVVLVSFVLLGIAISGLLQVLQLRIVENIQQDVFARSAFEFAYRIPKITLKQLDKIHTPELVNRFFDTLTIQKGLPKILIDFSLASFQITFGLILLTIYSPFFIILAVVFVFVLWLIVRLTGPRGLKTSLKESKYKYRLAYWLEETARANRTFKVNTQSNLHLKRTDDITVDYICAREKHFQVLYQQFQLFIAFRVIVAAGLLILGSVLVFNEQMDIGQFVAAEIMIILIINSVEKLIIVMETIYDVLTGLEKIGFVTDLNLDKNIGNGLVNRNKPMSIEAKNLDFSFPGETQKIIDRLSFKIEENAKVIITGKSGSGKSTLLQVLAGLYPPEGGELLLNGVPIQNYGHQSLHESIGMGFSVNQLFDGSIFENITMGRDVSEEALNEVVDILGLTDFIAKQQHGIHSHIDSGGRRLPRRIIQLITIARIIVGKPNLLILEDPLQFLEDEEKKNIIDYLMSPDRNWTVVLVADYHYWKTKCTQRIELKK